jgi:glycogen phosphorylase
MNPDEGAQDYSDAQDLYRILEQEVIPLYYGRNEDGVPEGWCAQMRRSIASTIWNFSTTRMLHEYVEREYMPATGLEPKRPAGRHKATEAG